MKSLKKLGPVRSKRKFHICKLGYAHKNGIMAMKNKYDPEKVRKNTVQNVNENIEGDMVENNTEQNVEENIDGEQNVEENTDGVMVRLVHQFCVKNFRSLRNNSVILIQANQN